MATGNSGKVQPILKNLEGSTYIQRDSEKKDTIHLALAGLDKQKVKAKVDL